MEPAQNMNNHFSKVASNYRQLRTTDVEPIVLIGKTLKGLPKVWAADIGCGAGRYDLLLFQYINNLHLTCIDINDSMLRQVADYLTSHKITNFKTIKADAEVIPLKNNSMDCILNFNAIHHFDFVKFIEKSEKIIKKDGRIFIYTRLRSQNAKSVWGKHFPMFSKKETRLYELYEIEQWVKSIDSIILEVAKPFKYKRVSSLEQLVEKVKARNYSTFSLYKDDELDEALYTFQENIREQFLSINNIEWFDENILLILKPK